MIARHGRRTGMTGGRQWIILAEDGRYVTPDRNSDPSDEGVAHAGNSLCATGIGGWLIAAREGFDG